MNDRRQRSDDCIALTVLRCCAHSLGAAQSLAEGLLAAQAAASVSWEAVGALSTMVTLDIQQNGLGDEHIT
jgi:hypothetical protein